MSKMNVDISNDASTNSHSISGPSSVGFIEESISKISKGTFNFMEKRHIYRVFENDTDVTPDDIVDNSFITMDEVYTHAAFETKTRKSEVALKIAKSSRMSTEMGVKIFATTVNLDDIHIDYTLNTEEGFVAMDVDIETAPSAYYLPIEKPIMSYPPEIVVNLKETPTVFLFDIPTFCYDKNNPETSAIEEENELYTYMTIGKGRNRKTISEETQTNSVVTQTRHTLATRSQRKNVSCFASMWDMHDTYAKLAKVKAKEDPDEMVLYQSVAPKFLREKKRVADDDDSKIKKFDDIVNCPEFFDAVLLVERVIASKQYSDAQKKFRGLILSNPLSLDLIYVYSMKSLWTFECEDTVNHPIISISFNPKNPNILAVGYGKFTYAERPQGLVCVWCTKNPCKPERLYRFETPLTSLSFSNCNPNWLACGFENGDVLVLDITNYFIKTIAKSKRNTNPCFEPIWATNWRITPDQESEYVITACQDGRINRFTSTKTHDFICSPMMRLASVEGKMKGLDLPKTCVKFDVPITRNPAALCMKWHPSIEHIYLVGTDEGCIHQCSRHYLNQHMDVYRAHAGPVYSMEYSPFMKNLLVSCGADNCVRLWLEGMDEVIMTLSCSAAVYGIAFCPINATILLSISGNILSVWDLRRKVHIPCAEYTFPGNVTLTYIKFSESGDNVFVGDSTGKVHTFHLEDTPIPPYYQLKMLDDAIRRALCTRPQLLTEMEKLTKSHP